MGKVKDLTGEVYGKLTVLRLVKRSKSIGRATSVWLCECECEATREVTRDSLVRGYTYQCVECTTARLHGDSRTTLYTRWSTIKNRILNPKDISYNRYGGLGMTMAKEWIDSYKLFKEYMLSLPNAGNMDILSIDRVHNGFGYHPMNLRWATDTQQARNKGNKGVIYE